MPEPLLPTKVNILQIITAIAGTVRVIEMLFSRRGSGPKRGEEKYARAVRQVLRLVDPDGRLDGRTVGMITTLIGVLGKYANERDVVDHAVAVFTAVSENIDLARQFTTDRATIHSLVFDAARDALDIPGLGVNTEAMMLDLVIGALTGAQPDELLGTTWGAPPAPTGNADDDIPF